MGDQANDQPSQHAQQQGLNQRMAFETGPELVLQASVHVQQLLRQQAALLRKLQEGARVVLKPIHGKSVMKSAMWSPCGRWVALQQVQPQSHLIIWDTQSNSSQEIMTLPQGHFLKIAWLPGTSWLLYVKTHNDVHEFTHQSIWCHDMASGEVRDLLDRPHRHWHGRHVPAVASTGHVMAYVHRVCIVLLELPFLNHRGTLSPAVCSMSNVAAMGFNAAAAQLAVCWQTNAVAANNGAFCLDIFDLASHSRIFTLPCHSELNFCWSPTSSNLLISTGDEVILLDTANLCCRYLPKIPGHQGALHPPSQALLWTAPGDMALVRSKFRVRPRYASISQCYAVQLDGRIMDSWPWPWPMRVGPQDVGLLVLPHRHVPGIRDAWMVDTFWDADPPPLSPSALGSEVFISRCTRLAVQLPNDSWNPQHLDWQTTHADIDSAGVVRKVLRMPLHGVQLSAVFVWHPAPASSRVYAVAGREHDVWLVDGHLHRVLQQWSGSALFATQQAPRKARQSAGHSWASITWSNDGAQLLLSCACTALVIDFQGKSQLHAACRPATVEKTSSFKRTWKALQQSIMRR